MGPAATSSTSQRSAADPFPSRPSTRWNALRCSTASVLQASPAAACRIALPPSHLHSCSPPQTSHSGRATPSPTPVRSSPASLALAWSPLLCLSHRVQPCHPQQPPASSSPHQTAPPALLTLCLTGRGTTAAWTVRVALSPPSWMHPASSPSLAGSLSLMIRILHPWAWAGSEIERGKEGDGGHSTPTPLRPVHCCSKWVTSVHRTPSFLWGLPSQWHNDPLHLHVLRMCHCGMNVKSSSEITLEGSLKWLILGSIPEFSVCVCVCVCDEHRVSLRCSQGVAVLRIYGQPILWWLPVPQPFHLIEACDNLVLHFKGYHQEKQEKWVDGKIMKVPCS